MVADNAITYFWIDGTGTVRSGVGGYPVGAVVLMGRVTAAGGQVSSIAHDLVAYNAFVSGGPSNAPTNYDFFLDNEPDQSNHSYAVSRDQSGRVIKETWIDSSSSKIFKTIDYTRGADHKVQSEVRRIFAPDGSTVVAQLTESYTRAQGRLSGSSIVRDL